LLAVVLAGAAILSGCDGVIPIEEYGALSVTVQESELGVSKFEVSISGPSEPYSAIVTPDDPVAAFYILLSGMWTVSVFGVDETGSTVASGLEIVEVFGEDLAEIDVPVEPLEDRGHLTLTMSWPKEIVGDPALEGFVYDSDGVKTELAFTLDSYQVSAAGVQRLPPGEYGLVARLLDGTTVVFSPTETITIETGKAAALTYNLTEDDFDLGGIEVSIDEQLDQPFSVSIVGLNDTIPRGSTQVVTAVTDVDPAVALDYRWYLDGELLSDATGPDLELGPDLPKGSYELSVVAVYGTVLGSATSHFIVTAATLE
jgi:hypothetical protein